jgi:hypothetical protein
MTALSTLSLFVTGILTDNPNNSFTFDYLAFIAHLLDRSSNFHDEIILRYLTLPKPFFMNPS